MYNLLVTAGESAWTKGAYTYDLSRFLEHTSAPLKARFRGLSDDVKAELMRLPSLFAYETELGADARIGWINAIEVRGTDIRVGLELDSALSPLAMTRLEALSWELDIGSWEMNRTHWAVKDVDLLGVVTGKAREPRGQRPYALGAEATRDEIADLVAEEGLEALVRAVQDAMEQGRHEEGLDRLHTYATGFLRARCRQASIATDRKTPLHSLLGGHLKELRRRKMIETEMTDRILKSSISVLEAFNTVRNEHSLAHDNPALSNNEARLITHHVVGVFRFLREIERSEDGQDP